MRRRGADDPGDQQEGTTAGEETRFCVGRIRREPLVSHDTLRPHGDPRQDGMPGGPRRAPWAPAFVTAAAVALVACGDESATTGPGPTDNRPPVAVGSIPALVLEYGEYTELNLTAYFSDPDGDPLTYALPANSDDRVSITDSVMRVETVGGLASNAIVEVVIARDPHGEEADQGFEWTIVEFLPDRAALERVYHATGGRNWIEADNWLTNASVRHWAGVDTDSSGSVVTGLDLTGNGLAGRLPADLGALPGLSVLRIGGNAALSGRLPLSLTQVSLAELHYADTGLCVPAEESFQAWLNTIPSHEGTGVECAPLTDREILEVFYDATGGPNWTYNDNWLTDAPVRDWYGLRVDAEERVVQLSLADNNLTGVIPTELGNLASLEYVNLRSNRTTGPIPRELGNLAALKRLSLAWNDLSGPIPPEIGNLTALEELVLGGNEHSGPIPPEIGNLIALKRLSLSGNDLSGPIPPEIGDLTALEYLELAWNDFSGPIPREIGGLAALEYLGLYSNQLNGPIPPEIGSLGQLKELELYGNRFSGPIPAEIGDLARLEHLGLGFNDFSGPIPPWIDRLTALRELDLRRNRFSGPLPPRIGDLARLERLNLPLNDLSGAVPPDIGQLASLTWLNLTGNNLSGPVPPELAGSASLKVVSFTDNPGMAGALPAGLTGLRDLEVLQASGTGLCAPSDPDFLAWLERIGSRRIRPCVERLAAAYLTQPVQSREFPVPLVAGRRALLRVFPTARRSTSARIPPVRASFWVDGRERHVVNIPGTSTAIPTAVDEASLAKSANAEIPGHVVQPGLEMVIEVDPQGTLDSSLLVEKRIPQDGRLAVDVRAMPVLDLTVIPLIWSVNPDRSIVSLVRDMAADPANHEMLWATRTLLPVGVLDVTAHEPVLTSTNDAYELHSETGAIRTMEGGTNRYLGMMMADLVTGEVAGVASGADVSFAITSPTVIAHELGHNMSLDHAPCGSAGGVDAFYPYSDGSIGAWGYDFRDDGLVARSDPDLMSYCGPEWISDYHFSKALHWRVREEENALGVPRPDRKALLLWGGVGPDGQPFLEPAFVVDAPPAPPNSTGQHRITGRGDGGGELFSVSFAMSEMADGDGRSSFAFALPIRPGWDALASITLTGPGGSVTLDGDSNIPVAILRNPRTGQVRGILRDPPPATQAAADAVGQGVGTGLDVLFSRGIPAAAAWRR